MKDFAVRLLMSVAALGLISASAKANVVYDFSVYLELGPVNGTLDGSFDLSFLAPGGSGTGAASSLNLADIPAGLGSFSEGNDATQWTNVIDNSFTVDNGTITSIEFFATTAAADPADVLCLNSNSTDNFGAYTCWAGLNEVQVDNTDNYGYDFSGLSAVAFTPEAATPEPSEMALVGLGVLAVLARYRRGWNVTK